MGSSEKGNDRPSKTFTNHVLSIFMDAYMGLLVTFWNHHQPAYREERNQSVISSSDEITQEQFF